MVLLLMYRIPMKITVPNRPEMAASGTSASVKDLDMMSTRIMKIPPNSIVSGIVFAVFLPTSILTMCGMTRPIHPTLPTMETALAVIRVAMRMMALR